jgi:hypothetical protein
LTWLSPSAEFWQHQTRLVGKKFAKKRKTEKKAMSMLL